MSAGLPLGAAYLGLYGIVTTIPLPPVPSSVNPGVTVPTLIRRMDGAMTVRPVRKLVR